MPLIFRNEQINIVEVVLNRNYEIATEILMIEFKQTRLTAINFATMP